MSVALARATEGNTRKHTHIATNVRNRIRFGRRRVIFESLEKSSYATLGKQLLKLCASLMHIVWYWLVGEGGNWWGDVLKPACIFKADFSVDCNNCYRKTRWSYVVYLTHIGSLFVLFAHWVSIHRKPENQSIIYLTHFSYIEIRWVVEYWVVCADHHCRRTDIRPDAIEG